MQAMRQPSTNPGRIGLPLLFLYALFARAETTIIDAGSLIDSNFTGGTAYTMATPPTGITDITLRYGATFSYDIPCHTGWPYVVTFRFLEPTVSGPGQRMFSVRINNQLVLDRLDLIAEGGSGKMLARSVVVMGADDGHLRIGFEASIRSAVVSAIEFTPLFQVIAGLRSLETAARAVFAIRCVRCHGGDIVPGDTHLVNGLDLRTVDAMLRGGKRGPAIIPGKGRESIIVHVISRRFDLPPTPGQVDTLDMAPIQGLVSMPPFDRVSDAEISAIRDWIDAGAPSFPVL